MTGRGLRLGMVVVGLGLVILACGTDDESGSGTTPESVATPSDAPTDLRTVRTGGMGTALDQTPRAFSLTARNINHYERQAFADGKAVFETVWTATGEEFAGLGPAFDAPACSTCHTEDGRAAGPGGNGPLPIGFTVGLTTDQPATIDHYGASLGFQSVEGAPEATVSVTFEEVSGSFDDGTTYSLRRPVYTADVGDGPPLPDDAVLSVRVAPQLPGLGLLELVPEEDLIARADPDDGDGDGISGRLGTAVDLLNDTPAIGRFGWTAGQPTVEQQTATALFRDMGLTSRYFPSHDCDRWSPCVREGIPLSTEYNVADYGDPNVGVQAPADGEVTDLQLLNMAVYSQTLAVPAPRDLGEPEVEAGWELFNSSGCSSCHAGAYRTEKGPIEGLSDEVIQPYTDLLVHDLGIGLSDQTVAGDPVPTEWRTPPLWGIGLIDTVSGHTTLLHDGRARDLTEAILWHEGEAAASAAAFRAMSASDRDALLAFLESL